MQLSVNREDPSILEKVLGFCETFYESSGEDEAPTFSAIADQVTSLAKEKWVDAMLARPDIHDQDYQILKVFQNPNTLILDIGANWGYSAGAFFKLGVKSKILSIEVLEYFGPLLERIKSKHPGNYDYIITGLGAEASTIRFVVPTVNGIALDALCSAAKRRSYKSLARGILRAAKRKFEDENEYRIRLVAFSAPVDSLDGLISSRLPKGFEGLPIEALKADVEGLGYAVLRGGEKLLREHKPLVLLEGGNKRRDVRDYMRELGYFFAYRNDDHLVRLDGIGDQANLNGFFVHESKADEYERLGMLVQS